MTAETKDIGDEVDFVFNEQKVRDVEITLYQLEQKMLKIESQMQNNVNFDMNKMADLVSKKMDQKPVYYMPNIMRQLQSFKNLEK